MDDSRRCTATSKRSGNRCGRAAIIGGTVCNVHGGRAPQVKQAAEIRAAKMAAHDQAERMVARAGVDADPIAHLLESLHRSAALVEIFGVMVAALDAEAEAKNTEDVRGGLGYEIHVDEESGHEEIQVVSRDRLLALDRGGMAKLHPYYTEYREVLELRAKMAKLCIDAGIAEREVRVAEEQGQQIAGLLRDVFADLGIEITPKVSATVGRHLRLVTKAG